MQLKPGYKQTDVGIIPEDWDVSRIGSIAETSSGTTPARAFHERYYRNGSIAWVKTMDLNNSEIKSTSEQVTELALRETCLRIYPAGTVLVAMYGGFQQIGRTGLLKIPATVNQAISAVQPDEAKVVPEYLLATLNYRVEHWKRVASSSRKDPNISSQDIRDFSIAFPATAEQHAITEVLGDVDALLTALGRLIAKKQDLKQAARQQLLTGRTRLPGFKDEWTTKRLGDEIFDLLAGVSVNSLPGCFETDGGSKRILKTSAVTGGTFRPTEAKIIAPKDLHRATLSPLADAVLISRMNTVELVGECGYVPTDFPDLFIPDRLWMTRFRPNAKLSAKWLSFALSTPVSRSLLRNIATGTSGSMKNISKSTFLYLKFRMPSLAEQSAIARVLSDIDAELAVLEQHREKTCALKQGMMQELLTGRTRLV